MSGQGLYLAVPTPKEVVLLKLYVLRRHWHPATINLFHSRDILILDNSKTTFNKSTIEIKLNFARQQFAEARIKLSLNLLATITTSKHVLPFICHQGSA